MGRKLRQSQQSREHDVLVAVLTEAREQAGISQRELARRLGMAESVIGRIERGERVVDVVEFVRIATVLGADPIEIISLYVKKLIE